jgi:hypothetical protein
MVCWAALPAGAIATIVTGDLRAARDRPGAVRQRHRLGVTLEAELRTKAEAAAASSKADVPPFLDDLAAAPGRRPVTEVSAIAATDGTVYGPDLQPAGTVSPFAALAGAVPASAIAPPPAGLVAEERDRAAEVARQLTGAVRAYSANRPRSLQRRIGPSEVGSPCTRRLGYKLAGVEPVNTSGGDPWASFVGTATHAELEQVFKPASPAGRPRSASRWTTSWSWPGPAT